MPSETNPTVIHLLPHFHYDTVYLKTYDAYLRDALEHIHEALRIMETEPGYTFMIEQMILVEEYWRRFPEQRRRLRKLAAEGRIEIACGMYCMPDVNLPSGESFIRQVQIGKKMCREMLGVDVRVAWMSDCFGHHPQLPQLLEETGYELYVFSRGADETMQTPFRWKGLDGTELKAHRLHGGYGLIMFSSNVQNALELNFGKTGNAETIKDKANKLLEVSATSNHVLLPNGGDMAKPQREAAEAVREFNERYESSGMKARFSTVQAFLEAVSGIEPSMQTYTGEINPVFQGTYSSRMAIKLKNRELEWKLQAVERLQATLMLSGVINAPVADVNLQSAWKDVLYNQFHDIICGTILDEGYLDTMNRYKRAEQLLNDAVSELIDTANADPSGEELVAYVFNPSGFARKEAVELNITVSAAGVSRARVWNAEGAELSAQCSILESDAFGTRKLRVVFTDSLEAMSLRTYRLELTGAADGVILEQKPHDYKLEQTVDGYIFENRFMQLQITSSGGIKHFVSRPSSGDSDRDWVEQGKEWNDIVLMRDQGDLWLYDEPILNGAYTGPTPMNGRLNLNQQLPYSRRWLGSSSGSSSATIRIEEEGPDRVVLCSTGKVSFWQNTLTYTKRIILDGNGNGVRFITSLTGTGKQYRVLAAFPTSLEQPSAVQQIPFGWVERGEGEFPAQNWARIASGNDRLSISNAGIPGNGLEGSTAWLALTRSAAMPYKAVSDLAYEEGVTHTYTYEIRAQSSEDAEDFSEYDRNAESLNLPFVTAIRSSGNSGSPVPGVSCSSPHMGISSFHYCSETGGLVLRVYDASGHGSSGTVRLLISSHCQKSIQEQNTIHQPKSELVPYKHDEGIQVVLEPFQIRTFAIL